ncbi:MAG: lyase family protein [Marmoricola sp.]
MPEDTTDLFWPGDHRAGDVFTDAALVVAMVRVEEVWLATLVAAGIAPPQARHGLADLVDEADLPGLARSAEGGGNPLIPLLSLLRERLRADHPTTAEWLHRGLTSQDVVDTAVQLCARDALDRLGTELKAQTDALAALAVRHERTVMAARTLTQHAVPTSFGIKAAHWLSGVLDARSDLDRVFASMPAQLGGAAGTLSAVVEMAGRAGLDDPERTAMALVEQAAEDLGLAARAPWHTSRAPVTRLADALVRCTDAWGHIANDVLLLARPEIGELAEPARQGRGGSSTMPQKANPVLSVLIRRAALAAPQAAATLHLAAAEAVDERPDGAWHTEWATLRTLARRTVVAGSQTTELLSGLHVDTGRMERTAASSASALLAEQRSVAALYDAEATDFDPLGYLGATGPIIDAVIDRARNPLEDQ